MSRGTFYSHNKVGETMSFKTNASSTTTFDPRVEFTTGSDRVSWDMGDGSEYQAGNSITYVYSDTGSTKTVTLRTNKLRRLRAIDGEQENIVGNLDLSGWVNLENASSDVNNYNQFGQNTQMTGITNPNSAVNGKILTHYNIFNSDITGVLVLTGLTLGGYFDVSLNGNLTTILHGPSNQVFDNRYNAYNCDLTGNLDLSMLTGLGGDFNVRNNSGLTGITHTASTEVFTTYDANNCGLTGNLDLSMLTGLGGNFYVYINNSLTSITHTASTQVFVNYKSHECNLTGTLDLSMFPNFGGDFRIYSNSALTNITHTVSTQTFNRYWAHNCGLSGTIDLSMLTGLGGEFRIYDNTTLENITHPISTGNFSEYYGYGCILSSIDFFPLSGATMSDIQLWDNGMTSTEVNTILWDFYELNYLYGQVGWSACTLDIGGTNAAPTLGPPDGITAKNRLINDYGWTITSS
jgi:hypothetical protein